MSIDHKTLALRETAIAILSAAPNTRLTARDLATRVVAARPEAARLKLERSEALADEAALLQQVVAEIGANRPAWEARHPEFRTTEGRPRRYFWSTRTEEDEIAVSERDGLEEAEMPRLTEADLYPILGGVLRSGFGVWPKRIDERRGSNRMGAGANRWLYPDIVGVENLSERWADETRSATSVQGIRRVRLWSVEVKLVLNRSNVREAFFQAVSNSSWANVGYLAAAEIVSNAMPELRMLSALHGIGVLLIEPSDPHASQTVLPARERLDVDWDSCDRLVRENADFEAFLRLVRQFHQTGDLRPQDGDTPRA